MAVVEVTAHTQRPARRPAPRRQVAGRPLRARPDGGSGDEWAEAAAGLAAFVSAGRLEGTVDFWAEAAAAEQRRARLVAGWDRPTATLAVSAVGLLLLDVLASVIR